MVTCLLDGDLAAGTLTIAVVLSDCGYPYLTEGENVGEEGGDDSYVMSGFEDLFQEYHSSRSYEEPHSGMDIDIGINYTFPFMDFWDAEIE